MGKKIKFRKKKQLINLSEDIPPSPEYFENNQKELKKYIKLKHEDCFEVLQEAIFTIILLNAWTDEPDKKKAVANTYKIMADVRESGDVIRIEFLEFYISIKAFMPGAKFLKWNKDDKEMKEINDQYPMIKMMFDGWVLSKLKQLHCFKRDFGFPL